MSGSLMFRSLRQRSARWFFLGLSVSQVGTWMQTTAMSLLVYRLTGKAADVGINLFCQFLPMLVLGAWAGAVADRTNKQRMALVTQGLQGLQALTIGALVLTHHVNLPVVFSLSLVLGVVAAIDNPARRGFVIELVPPADIANVVSLNTAVMTGSRIFGPAIAAALIGPLGPGWLCVLNGASFTAIMWPIARIDRSTLFLAPHAPKGGTPVRDALRFVAADRRLRIVFVSFVLLGTFAFNYNVSLLKLADRRFGDKALFGWLLAFNSIGNLAGSLATAARPRVSMRYFYGAAAMLGATGVVMAWSPNIWWAYALNLPVGAAGAAVIASLNAISQELSPPDMRGRLLALGAVAFLGTTPIGAPVTGMIADRVGAEWSQAYGNVIALVVVAGALLWWKLSEGADVPADQHEPAAVDVDDADGRRLVVEGGA